jgi:phosphatidylserine/phosphatidylglycerophosphate/cardiolipin synthase-like enzyme
MPHLAAFLRKNFIFLFLIIAVYIWYFATHTIHDIAPTKVLTANSQVSLYVEPENGKTFLTSEIKKAKKEIFVEVYLLSDKDVISALEEARTRGVNVEVMMEEHPFGGGGINPKTKSELSKHRVNVAWTNPNYSLTHEKSIVIDGKEAFIMNQNLTTSSFSKNREYDILDRNSNDVAQIRNIFISDWKKQGYSPPNESSLVISPVNSRKILTSLIRKPAKTLDLEFEEIQDPVVITQIADLAKTERVRVIIPPLPKLDVNSKAAQQIKSSGGSVRFLSTLYPHAKLIISGGNTAYVGSINLSTQSMDENRELGIILSNTKILNTLSQTFETDWNNATPAN